MIEFEYILLIQHTYVFLIRFLFSLFWLRRKLKQQWLYFKSSHFVLAVVSSQKIRLEWKKMENYSPPQIIYYLDSSYVNVHLHSTTLVQF